MLFRSACHLSPPHCSLTCEPASLRVSPAATRRRESEKSLENEAFAKEDDAPSPTSKPKEEKPPLKVMPAPPPKENAWVKRSGNPPARSQSSDSEQHSPTRLVPRRRRDGTRRLPALSRRGFSPPPPPPPRARRLSEPPVRPRYSRAPRIPSPQAVTGYSLLPLRGVRRLLLKVLTLFVILILIIFFSFPAAAARRRQARPWKTGRSRRTPTGKVRLGLGRRRVSHRNRCKRTSKNHPGRGE